MDDDGSLGMRNWGFFDPPTRNNLGLQLMSSMPADRDTKQLLSSSPFIHQHHHVHPHAPQHTHHHPLPHPHPHLHPRDGCGGVSSGAPNDAPSMPMNFVHNEAWMHPAHHPRESKILHAITTGHAGHVVHAVNPDPTGYGIVPGTHGLHTLQMMQKAEPPPPPPPKDECISPPLVEENAGVVNELPPPKKKQQRRQPKSPKPKKAKKAAAPCGAPKPVPRRRGPKKHVGMVINGIDLDLSRIPTPVCTCTGAQQQCYRWGAGGWQSACCTTTISTYPLPMSTKRHGARIAGRKMSHGAFKKVLEKLAGEGYNLNNPIDLKTFWAKHGTNKFVTIR